MEFRDKGGPAVLEKPAISRCNVFPIQANIPFDMCFTQVVIVVLVTLLRRYKNKVQ